MKFKWMLTILIAASLYACSASAEEYDFYKNLRFHSKLVPGVGLDKIEQAGGPDAAGYQRRTVKWWPRKGQDIIDIPKGAPLRTWTRNKGQKDKEALAGLAQNWTQSDSDTFKAHLVGLRGFAVPTPNPTWGDEVMVPAAVLRLEDGRQKAMVHYKPLSLMLSAEDHKFLFETWKKAWPKLEAAISPEEFVVNVGRDGAYDRPGHFVLESKHWRFQTGSKTWFDTFHMLCPQEPDKQARYRKGTLEFAENLWTYVESAGARMPFWREGGPFYKFTVTTGPAIVGGWRRIDPGNGGGYGCCTLYWCGGGPRNVKLSHEFFHSGYHAETGCNAGIHMLIPGEMQMFSHNLCYPWRNVMTSDYQGGLWMAALGDNPNWGCGIVAVLGSLRSSAETSYYHVIARLGQKKGLWTNGIKGCGDFFGEYAARMVTLDYIAQPMLRPKYGMPEVSYVYPVYGAGDTFRIPNSEVPWAYGFNIVRLTPDAGAKQVAVDFRGFHDPDNHSDWRACIVAVDAGGRARYSPMWNKGKMTFALKPTDKHLWLTVAATPSALPVSGEAGWFHGIHAPRFPWEVTLTGCKPGTPHRRQGDVVNLDALYTINNTNFYVDHAVKHEVPIPSWHGDATEAPKKLAAMLPRIKAASEAVQARLKAGNGRDEYWLKDWWEHRKLERLEDLQQRVKFLQRNAKGHRHSNGGGFVSDNARVAETAYVGPNAMVLDGGCVKDNACIKEFAVVIGPDALVSGNAKIGGKAWVFGKIKVGGNARILESVILATKYRRRGGYHVKSTHYEGAAEVTGSAVIKGEHIMRLCYVKDQVLTGELVVDYTPKIANRSGGVFSRGRFYQGGRYNWAYTPEARLGASLYNGLDTGAIYANWEFDQPKSCMLEDSHVNNNGILHGRPEFSRDNEHRFVVFNGTDQYAEAPPSVADFGELTIDMMVNRSADKSGRLFDFGTGDDECFYLEIAQNGKPSLTAKHNGKSYNLTASQGIAADKWVRVRVEIDGKTASIYIDGKKVAGKAFAFAPRAVFIGDRPEGNFIARGRKKVDFFKGKMDYFRIYRQVRDDFDAIDFLPPALTQVVDKESCERASKLAVKFAAGKGAAEWAKRRAAKVKALPPEPARGIPGEGQKLSRRKNEILNKSKKLSELNEKRGTLHRKMSQLDKKVIEKFEALAETLKTKKEIAEHRKKIDDTRREIRTGSEYTGVTKAIQEAEQRLRKFDTEVRGRDGIKSLEEKARAADTRKREIDEAIRNLPELKEAMDLHRKEKDRRKRDQLRRKYDSLLNAKMSSDPARKKAEARRLTLWNRYNKMLKDALDFHIERTTTIGKLDALRKKLPVLTARLEADSSIGRLEKSLERKRQDLEKKKREFMAAQRKSGEHKDEYRKILAELATVDRAIPEEKNRMLSDNLAELAAIGKRLYEIEMAAKWWRYDGQGLYAQRAGLTPNPFAIHVNAGPLKFQQGLKFTTTVNWDYRVGTEVRGKLPPIMKKWLQRVRGY